MKIIHLIPGTGNFYCGNCLRDHALAGALRRRGHDVVLVPLYLPVVFDHPPDEHDRVPLAPMFFGGINVYLQQNFGLFRYTPRWIDRLFNAPALLRLAARQAHMTQASDLGEMTISMLRGEEGRQAKELEKLIDWLAAEKPDVISISNLLLMGLGHRLRQALAAPVVVSMQGEDTFLDSLDDFSSAQCWDILAARCADADAFLACSKYFGDLMSRRLSLPADKVHVVYNGLDQRQFQPPPSPPTGQTIGYLARMHPNKGLEGLVDAFILLKQGGRIPAATLQVAGSMTPEDEPFVEHQRERLRRNGCEADVEFLPNLSTARKVSFLQGLRLLSVPAMYGEAFGLYLIEAMACGVPVVQPRHAAFPELVEASGAGLLCEPDDPGALAAAWEELLLDPERAAELGRAGLEAVSREFSVETMADRVMAVFEEACARR